MKKNGFGLAELIAVIAVLVLITIIVLVTYSQSKKSSITDLINGQEVSLKASEVVSSDL